MDATTKKVYEEAATLPEEERAALVIELVDSLDRDLEVSRAQSAESASRLGALEAGDLQTLDHEAALRLIAG